MYKIIIALILIGCSKAKCYDCTITLDIMGDRVTSETTKCGTVDEINDYQRQLRTTTYDANGDITSQQYCNCN